MIEIFIFIPKFHSWKHLIGINKDRKGNIRNNKCNERIFNILYDIVSHLFLKVWHRGRGAAHS